MELRHLRYFVAVAEELTFTRAARQLHTAQPSLSQQIKQLEGHVGTPLLDRTNRRVRLTAAGRVFLREARDVLSRSEQAVHAAARAGSGHAGEISIGVMPAAGLILPNCARSAVTRSVTARARTVAGARQRSAFLAILRLHRTHNPWRWPTSRSVEAVQSERRAPSNGAFQ
jgi:hypothetical protein